MTVSKQPSLIEYCQRCLFLSMLALVCNLFLPVSLIGEAKLSFGSIFVLLSIVILPTKFALFVLFSSILSLWLAGQNHIFIIAHALEITIIALIIYRNVFIMIAAFGYWLCIGMPFIWLMCNVSPPYLKEISLLVSIQYGLNGLLCAAIAASILAVMPSDYKQSEFVAKEHRLSSNIFAICASVLVVPILIISFLFIGNSSNEHEELWVDKIKSDAGHISQLTNAFIDEHKLIVEQVAALLRNGTEFSKVQQFMLDSQVSHPAFFNITVTDERGQFLYFAPEKYNSEIARLPPELQTVSDRNYFNAARNSGETFISNTLLSRGVVVAPMVSIAAPIITDGEFKGIVFGAINLDAIKNFRIQLEQLLDKQKIIITDAANLTIYASKSMQTDPLSVFLPMPTYNYIVSELPVLVYEDVHYVYHREQTSYGWKVYVLTESAYFSNAIRDYFVIAGISLAIVIAIFLLFAHKMAHRITAPLIALLESDQAEIDAIASYPNSKEFSDVANKLKRTQFLMRNFENRLKQQVNEKTEQLEQLNLQLAAQAREDGMTQLLNRSGFDELARNAIKTSYRLGQAFSLALLDIDHFKQVNDTHGHLFGDKCLQAFSALMQRNCKRDTDIIGRYGGEEFIILMSGKNIHAHHQLMQNIHHQTNQIRLKPANSDESVSFSVSIGICSVLGNVNLELQDIVRLADEELYKCKRGGRNQISVVTVGYTNT
uniref:sensor domain-containing diguanylate cyclase n=1 Tax=Ningiella ruwaisensis TaxID=2364274 RepID=UPI00109F4EB9|nr:diguanylate cyclase [Ningiella ruwaisensis]